MVKLKPWRNVCLLDKKRLKIQWKQQHINNACVPACLAMLLSEHDINKEDYDIIAESKMSYMIGYDDALESFTAGVLMQSKEVLNLVPNNLGLEYIEKKFDNRAQYLSYAKGLLENDIPFITSVAKVSLPCPCYSHNNNSSGHAVVIFNFKDDCFYIYDPDGGINRDKENRFIDVEKIISYTIHSARLLEGIEARRTNIFIIGYLQKALSIKDELYSLLMESRKSAKRYTEILNQRINRLINNNEIVDYNEFYQFIMDMIKPLALDLRNALKAIALPTEIEKNLMGKLYEYQCCTMAFQKKLKDNANLSATEFFIELSKKAEGIQQYFLDYLESEMQRISKNDQ